MKPNLIPNPNPNQNANPNPSPNPKPNPISNPNRIGKALLYLLFLSYVCVALNIILFKTIPLTSLFADRFFDLRSINLVPLRTIIGYLQEPVDIEKALVNIGGNIGIFVPLGLFVFYIGGPKSFGRQISFLFLTTLFLEVAQYALALGSSDVDDILLNAAGGAIGIRIGQAMKRTFEDPNRLLLAHVVFLCAAGLAGIAAIAQVDGRLLPFSASRTVFIEENPEIMGDLREAEADMVGRLLSIDEDALILQTSSKMRTGRNSSIAGEERVTVALDASAKMVIRRVRSEKNRVVSHYEEGSLPKLQALMNGKESAPAVRVWLSGDKSLVADAVLVSEIERDHSTRPPPMKSKAP
ncbi:VanZ family protein [Cohnella xylanilytica]|uniref:VanZ family protein n=1 Tax=Cohnella xylanilytica TaxID=557555 RepID=A0A841TUJ6_9BACL|nr:VanZ family protein [Cohnella xylanilytica]MBB6691349.1 VanZ family protein [Cohnella xylanilytica]